MKQKQNKYWRGTAKLHKLYKLMCILKNIFLYTNKIENHMCKMATIVKNTVKWLNFIVFEAILIEPKSSIWRQKIS